MKTTATKLTLQDEDIVQFYLQTRENKWFTLLYNRHVKKVYRLCMSVTKNSLLAEDFTQEIFLRIFHKLEQFEGRSSFSSWLYSLAYHYCLGTLRKASRLPLSPLDENVNNIQDTDDDNDAASRWQRLEQALAKLSSDDRLLLRLKYEEDLGIRDIAQAYETTDGTIKMRLKRARDRVLLNYNDKDIQE